MALREQNLHMFIFGIVLDLYSFLKYIMHFSEKLDNVALCRILKNSSGHWIKYLNENKYDSGGVIKVYE